MWDQIVFVEVDGVPIGVGCLDAAAADAVRIALADRLVEEGSGEEPPTFGIATAHVGLRRRTVAMLYHGRRIRHRASSIEAAASFLRSLLETIDSGDSRTVELPLRVFATPAGSVLLDCECSEFVDEFALAKKDVQQVPVLAAIVDPGAGTVLLGSETSNLLGVVVSRQRVRDEGDARNHLARLAGDRVVDWAWLIDRLAESVVVSERLSDAILRVARDR